MARNGSGTYTKVNTFTAGTPITAASHNQNWDDVAAEITNSVAADGQTSMTGPLKAATGTAASPSHTFASDLDTGGYRSASNEYSVAAGGAQIAAFNEDGVDIKEGTLKLNGTEAFPVPSAQIADKSITYRKLQHPSTTSVLLGSNSNPALTITGAANNGSGLIRLSVADTSTFETGEIKTVSDVTGTTEANGTWTITVADATHIDLQGSTFTNAWVSGGTIGGAFEEISIGAGLQLSGNVLSAPLTPQGYLFGLTCSNGTDTTNDINIAAGKCRDELDGATIVLSAITKQLDSAWAAGTNAGGRSSASLADGTWHVFAIAKADGTSDVLFHTALDPTSVLPSGYTVYRRICSIVRASGSIRQFTQQGDNFFWKTIAEEISGISITTTPQNITIGVPTGLRLLASVQAWVRRDSSTTDYRLFPTDFTDVAIDAAANSLPSSGITSAGGTGLRLSNTHADLLTSTSAQLRVVSSTSCTFSLTTIGWRDSRGRAF